MVSGDVILFGFYYIFISVIFWGVYFFISGLSGSIYVFPSSGMKDYGCASPYK